MLLFFFLRSHSQTFCFVSAGAGRTGAYIAIDKLTDKLQNVNSIDPAKEVMTMRENRKDMVQNAVGSFQSIFSQRYLYSSAVCSTSFSFLQKGVLYWNIKLAHLNVILTTGNCKCRP